MTASAADAEIVIALRDDGSGIAPGNRDRVFAPFFTTRREAGGTGIGLSIVAALVRAHDGRVDVRDAEAGACFELRLPTA